MKNVGNALDSREPGVTNWPVTTLRLLATAGYAAKG